MQSLGMDVLLGTAGSPDLLKALLRAGFPVIVNQTVSATDLEFHYRPVEGFDDDRGVFLSSDPLQGQQFEIAYPDFERDWTYTGQRFMVVFPPDKQDRLNAALAAGHWDPAYAEGAGQAQPWAIPGNGGPAPVTAPLFNGKPAAEPFYPGPVSIGFKATDPNGFGVAATAYVVDKQPPRLYRGPFTMDGAGKHTISFYSVGFSGSREQDKSVDVLIGQPSASPTPSLAAVETAVKGTPSATPAPSSTPVLAATAAPLQTVPAGGYKVCPLLDPKLPYKLGAVASLKLQLCEAGGKNLSSPAVSLSNWTLMAFPASTKATLPPPFHYEASLSGYECDIPAGLSQGVYVLYFTAAGDTVQHSVQFRIA